MKLANKLKQFFEMVLDCNGRSPSNVSNGINAIFIFSIMLTGKSLYVKRRHQKLAEILQNVRWNSSTIRLLEREVDIDDAIKTLTHASVEEKINTDPHFVHVDITPAVSN